MKIECNQVVFDSLESLCEFAYDQGYHELGYDPVMVVVDRIRELEAALRDVCYALPSKASVAKRQALNILVPNAGLTAETGTEHGK